jgi:hypothetical protein
VQEPVVVPQSALRPGRLRLLLHCDVLEETPFNVRYSPFVLENMVNFDKIIVGGPPSSLPKEQAPIEMLHNT